MDKSAIRNFAVEARRVLMKTAATEAGFYGVTREECREPVQKGRDLRCMRPWPAPRTASLGMI